MVRHGEGHTWQREDAGFLGNAESVHRGWRPDLAGLGDLPPPGADTGGAPLHGLPAPRGTGPEP